jgi:tetratricopeptide (TPR) repeat protein
MNARLFILVVSGCLFLATSAHAATLDSARVLIENGWLNKAQALLEPVLQSSPTNAEAHFLQGRVYLALRNHRQAERHLKRASELDDSHYEYFLNYGNALAPEAVRDGQVTAAYQAGLRAYERAIELAPDSTGPRIALVSLLMRAPDTDEATVRTHLDSLFVLDSAAGYWTTARLLEFVKDNPEAAELELLRAVKQDAARVESLLRLAAFYMRQEMYLKAEPVYRQVLLTDSINSTARMQLGFICQAQSRFGEAFGHFGKALNNDTANMSAAYQIGRTAVMSETELPLGEKALQRYLEAELKPAWPDKASAHWRLAMIYKLQGKQEVALEEVGRALKLNPKHPEALELQRELQGQ